jgi:hypothetical protein
LGVSDEASRVYGLGIGWDWAGVQGTLGIGVGVMMMASIDEGSHHFNSYFHFFYLLSINRP